MKKQTLGALLLLLLIPVVSILGGFVFSRINPEIAAGHANYVRNFHLLSLLKTMAMLGSTAIEAVLWLLACFLVIRSKGRSAWWLSCAALGPLGFAILMTLNDKAQIEIDRYTRFVRGLNKFVRVAYEICVFVAVWELAWEAMLLKRDLMIMYQSATTGMSTAQIIDLQNASSGMWAFGEGLEVMYIAVILYVLWPVVFNFAAWIGSNMGSPKHSGSPTAYNS